MVSCGNQGIKQSESHQKKEYELVVAKQLRGGEVQSTFHADSLQVVVEPLRVNRKRLNDYQWVHSQLVARGPSLSSKILP